MKTENLQAIFNLLTQVFFPNTGSWKGQTAPAELWHEADGVSGRHHRAVPAGTLAERTRGSEQQGQVHSGLILMKSVNIMMLAS